MKKTSSFIFLVVIGASLALLTACEYDIIVPEKIAPPPPGDTISFAQDVIPVFNASCNASCHRTGAIAPDLSAANAYVSLTTGEAYVVAGDPASSLLYSKCKAGGSMETYCSSVQLDLIYRWIYAGAENN